MSQVNPFTYKPKPYTLESLNKLKDEANTLFEEKKFIEAIHLYHHISEDFAHNEDDDVIVLQMKCRLNIVASILELCKPEYTKEVNIPINKEKENSNKELEHIQKENIHKLDLSTLPEFNMDYALNLCNMILNCEEAIDLHIKAIYRKIHILKHFEKYNDAILLVSDAMKRFPNAAFFRKLFTDLTNEEMKRREEKLTNEQKNLREATFTFSVFRKDEQIFGMFINDRKLSESALDKITKSTMKLFQSFEVLPSLTEKKPLTPTNITIFSFNIHNITAHISYAYQKGLSNLSKEDIHNRVCQSFFDLNSSSKRIIVYYNIDKDQSNSTQKEVVIDQVDLEQYQQLALIMKDRFGQGVTVSSTQI